MYEHDVVPTVMVVLINANPIPRHVISDIMCLERYTECRQTKCSLLFIKFYKYFVIPEWCHKFWVKDALTFYSDVTQPLSDTFDVYYIAANCMAYYTPFPRRWCAKNRFCSGMRMIIILLSSEFPLVFCTFKLKNIILK